MRLLDTEIGKMAVQEMPPVWYDNIYGMKKSVYLLPACQSTIYPIWRRIVGLIGSEERVMDLGCGTGQLAQVLMASRKNFVIGVDFSPVAIEVARSMMPFSRFELGNIYDSSVYDLCEYDCVVLCEVMEHLEEDLKVLEMVKPLAHVIFTVPSYITWSHVRGFSSESEVIERYMHLLEIGGIGEEMVNVEEGWKVWVVDSRRRNGA